MIDVGRRRLVLVAAGLLAVALVAGVAGPWLVDTGTAGDAAAFGVEEIGESAGFDYRVVQYEGVGRGGGVYVGDYDSDGWPDVLAVGGTPEAGGEGRPALYENTGGAFERSGALPDGLGRQTVAALFFDYDDDGREDLLLLRLRAEPLLLENEGGSFVRREGAFDAALTEPTGAAAADYDGDGCLDVFVVQNGDWTERTPVAHSDPGRDVTDDNGEPNYLFRGSCGEGFERVTDTGIEGTRWSLATSFVDLTGDGRPDVHVANDYNNDYVYVNEGDGTFAAVALGARTNRNGMSSEVLDVNGDGRLDLFVTNIYVDVANVSSGPIRNYLRYRLGKRADGGNNLLVNRGNGTFVDRAAAYGVRKGGWGWAAVATDFDNDGDQDLFHTTSAWARASTRRATSRTSAPPCTTSGPATDSSAGTARGSGSRPQTAWVRPGWTTTATATRTSSSARPSRDGSSSTRTPPPATAGSRSRPASPPAGPPSASGWP